MSVSIRLDARSAPESAPISFDLHLTTTLNVTAQEARDKVNQVVPDLDTRLATGEPELAIAGERIAWRLPILLCTPDLGDLGQVGAVDVDARTGEITLDEAARAQIIQHAQRLYAGAMQEARSQILDDIRHRMPYALAVDPDVFPGDKEPQIGSKSYTSNADSGT